MCILRSRCREQKEEDILSRDIVTTGLLFMVTSLLVLERLCGQCRELKRKEFLNQGVLNFNASFMSILFCFLMVTCHRVCHWLSEKCQPTNSQGLWCREVIQIRWLPVLAHGSIIDKCHPSIFLKWLQFCILMRQQESLQCGQQIIFYLKVRKRKVLEGPKTDSFLE